MRFTALTLGCALLASHALGQTAAFPTSKPIRIIVPAAPGGGTDILSCLLSPLLAALPFINVGRLRAIAVWGAKRNNISI